MNFNLVLGRIGRIKCFIMKSGNDQDKPKRKKKIFKVVKLASFLEAKKTNALALLELVAKDE